MYQRELNGSMTTLNTMVPIYEQPASFERTRFQCNNVSLDRHVFKPNALKFEIPNREGNNINNESLLPK